MNYKSIFIIGIQRSATTSLSHLMGYNDNIISCMHVHPVTNGRIRTFGEFKNRLFLNKDVWASPDSAYSENSIFADYVEKKKKANNAQIFCLKNDEGENLFIDYFSKMANLEKPLLIYSLRTSLFRLFISWLNWKKNNDTEDFSKRLTASFYYLESVLNLVRQGKVDLCAFSFFDNVMIVKKRAIELMNIIGAPISDLQKEFIYRKFYVAGSINCMDFEYKKLYKKIPKILEFERKYNLLIGQLDNGLIKESLFKEKRNV